MASLSDVDAEFFNAQQAALNRDDLGLGKHKARLRRMIGESTDLDWDDRRKLGYEAIGYVDQLRQLEAVQGNVISIRELMKRLGIGH